MTPDERAMLQRVAEMVQENNDLLRKMRRSQQWASLWRGIYWVVIVGSAIGAYWVIQPYIDQALGVYSGAQSNIDTVKSILGS